MAASALETALRVGSSLLPVLAFLAGLVLIDSYKLVPSSAVMKSLLVGAVVAVVVYFANGALLAISGIELRPFSRYLAPLVEEAAKAAYLVVLIRTFRVGFLVDAAIHGFAVGAGFALLENLYYLQAMPDASVYTSIVRGFGTAIMHGGASALFAILTKSYFDQSDGSGSSVIVIPGILTAYVLHSAYNHFILPPLLSTMVLVLVLPLLLVGVFSKSERATSTWLGAGFDADQELLRLLSSGDFAGSRIGRYLHALRVRFPGPVVADMLCLLRLQAELSVRAKGVLMLRKAGFPVTKDPSLQAKFDELAFLERSIGATGLLALAPFRHRSSRDLWTYNMLDPDA